jgi:hypothetical protein
VGGKGGNFAIVGPNWEGQIPEGLTEYHNSTNIGAVAARIYTSGEADDIATVASLQDQCKLIPLSKWGTDYTPPADVPIKPGIDTSTTIPEQVMAMSLEGFFNRLAMLLVNNPPHKADSNSRRVTRKIS